MSKVGKKMYDRRRELGLTLEQVGDAVGVGKSTVRKWETGEIKNMGSDKIVKLAGVLGLNPIDFVPVDANPLPNEVKVVAQVPRKGKSAKDALFEVHGVRAPLDPRFAQVKEDPKFKEMIGLWATTAPEDKEIVISLLHSMNKKGGRKK